MCYIIWVCVCSLTYSVRKAQSQYYVVVCGPSGSTVFFPHYVMKGTIFRNKNYGRLNGAFIISTTFVWSISRLKNNSARYYHKLTVRIHVKYSWFSGFNETWIFLTDFRKILKYYILWKSVQREQSWSLRTGGRKTDRQTRMTKLMVAFWNFVYAPRNTCIFLFEHSV